MGETIGRYELESEVADGALATVWRGRIVADAGFERPIAVRDLCAPLAKDASFLETWASIAAQRSEIASPHVEQVLDVIVDGPRALVVSEWIEGVSLRRWIAAHEAPVPWPLAVEIATQLLRGLRDAHAQTPPSCHHGILPASVRIARDGTVKLTRFGAAAGLASTGMGRRRMEELGLRHPAPELVAGRGAGPATDLLGVGALLFEILAGRPPWEGAPGPERDERVAGVPADLAATREDVPPLLAALVERSLRADPAERFGSAAQMARAFAQLLRSHPEPAGPELLAASSTSPGGRPPAASDVEPEAVEPEAEEPVTVQRQAVEREAEEPVTVQRQAVERETEEPPTIQRRAIEAPEAAPDELAAAVQAVREDAPTRKRPVGLSGTEQHTMHVDAAELIEIAEAARGGAAEDLAVAERVDSDPPPATDGEGDRPKRYRFEKKARTASASAQRAKVSRGPLEAQDSDAAPLPLRPKKPRGLSPAKTEFLDEDQVDRLTLQEKEARSDRSRPTGLNPAKTEFLDEDQVDRLSIGDDD